MITTKVVPSPLHGVTDSWLEPYGSGRTVGDYVPEQMGEDFYAKRNGEVADLDTLVADHDELTFVAVQGFESLAIAIAEFSFAEFIVTFFVASAVSYGLQMLIGGPGSPQEDDPNHTFGALENTTLPGTTIPIPYGDVRIAGHFINLFTRVNEQGDTVVHALICVGEGRIEALGDNTGGILGEFDRLPHDDPSIAGIEINGNGISNYPGVMVSFRSGEINQSPIKGFNEIVSQFAVLLDLAEPVDPLAGDSPSGAGPWLTRQTQAPVDAFIVTIAFPEGLLWITDKGKRTTREAHYQCRFRELPAGDWVWIDYDPEKNTYTLKPDAEVTYQDDDQQPDYASNNGRNDARPVHIAKRTSSTFESELRVEVDSIQVEVQIRRLNLRYQFSFIEQTALYFNFAGNDHRPPKGMNAMVWSTFSEVVDEQLSYPGLALVGVEAVARDGLQGRRPNFTFPIKGLRCPVWDGSNPRAPVFARKYTQNPAWHKLDLLTNEIYGLGRATTTDDIGLDTLLESSQWHDELVDDGRGGTEARHQHDRVILRQTSGWDALLEICISCGTGLIQRARRIETYMEKARPVAARFSRSETLRGTDDKSWLALQQPNQLVLQYLDRDLGFAQETVVAETAGLQRGEEDLVSQSRSIHGVTRQSQAGRVALAALGLVNGSNKTSTRTLNRRAANLSAGDRIQLEDDTTVNTVSGRLAADSADSSVHLDKTVTLEAGKTYSVEITHRDGTTEERTITSPAGKYKPPAALSVDSPWITKPKKLWPYGFGEQGSVWRDWLIVSATRTKELARAVSLVEYDDANYVDDGVVIVDQGSNDDPDPELLPPDVTNLTVRERTSVESDGSLTLVVEVSWNYAGNLQPRATVFYREVTELHWTKAGTTSLDEFLVSGDLEVGVRITVAVCAATIEGAHRPPELCPSAEVLVTGLPSPPIAPEDLTMNRNKDVLILGWSVPDDDLEDAITPIPNLLHFRAFRGSDFRAAPVVGVSSHSSAPVIDWYPGRECYLVKTVDSTNQFSNGTAYGCVDLEPPAGGVKLLERNELDLGWPGSKFNVTQPGAFLLLQQGEDSGAYSTPNIDLGSVKEIILVASAAIAQRELTPYFTMQASRVSTVSGEIPYGATITGQTSGATAKVLSPVSAASTDLVFEQLTGSFQVGETVSDSQATAVVALAPRELAMNDPARADRDFGGRIKDNLLKRTDPLGNTVAKTRLTLGTTEDVQTGFRSYPDIWSLRARARFVRCDIDLECDDPVNFGVGLYGLRLAVFEVS